MSFKDIEHFWSPSGMYIVLRPRVGNGDGWVVRVLDFATYKHQERQFKTRDEAARYADLWRI